MCGNAKAITLGITGFCVIMCFQFHYGHLEAFRHKMLDIARTEKLHFLSQCIYLYNVYDSSTMAYHTCYKRLICNALGSLAEGSSVLQSGKIFRLDNGVSVSIMYSNMS